MAPLLDKSMEIDLFQPPVLTHTKPVYNNPIDFSKQYPTLHPQGLVAKFLNHSPPVLYPLWNKTAFKCQSTAIRL